MKKYILPLSLVGAILLLFLGLWLFGGSSSPKAETPTDAPASSMSYAPASSQESPSSTVSSAVITQNQPQQLTQWLQQNGVSYESLATNRCQQLVVVSAEGTKANIHLFYWENNQWVENTALATTGYVGKNAVTANKTEGDGCTPTGLYAIGKAFYTGNTPPQTKLSCFQITENSYWVDDPNSPYYNQYVVTNTDLPPWNSAEHMIQYPGYEYGMVVQYNPQNIKGEGSAIFFHVGSAPTAGCIATQKEDLLAYLSALDPNCFPYILITQ